MSAPRTIPVASSTHDTGLRRIDRAFADILRRRDPDTDPLVLDAAARASFAVACGDAAFDLRQSDLTDGDLFPLDVETLQARLRASHWVCSPALNESADPAAPLVLEDGRLYLRRYREYEFRLAAHLRRIAAHAAPPAGLENIAPVFAALFPDARAGDVQARAAALALVRSLLFVTGGPGTGKTTTVARILLLLVARAQQAGEPLPRIALAAPTGRAAARMADSVRAAAAQLRDVDGVDPAWCDALPASARTLHRLLGSIPGAVQFRHGVTDPLPFDVVVVDEASMIDLPLMCKLSEAIADGARLLLLGDRDQLPSIEAGDVLAAMSDAALGDADGVNDGLPADLAQALTPLLGEMAVAAATPQPALAGHRVHLQRGYRQADSLDLAPLAAAVRAGDADAALALLRDGALAGVTWHPDLDDPLSGPTRSTLLDAWRAVASAADPRAALLQAARARLLTALRDGPQGAIALNARIEEAIAGVRREPYFHGRLLLVQQNDYRQQLFNGDIGVCWRDADGEIAAWFADGSDDGVRRVHPSALPAHDSAFAMTVHKAQGSEFDDVWFLLPRHDARTLSRELVYTAMTRARRALHVCAGEDALRAALARHVARVSGLQRRLSAVATPHSPT